MFAFCTESWYSQILTLRNLKTTHLDFEYEAHKYFRVLSLNYEGC